MKIWRVHKKTCRPLFWYAQLAVSGKSMHVCEISHMLQPLSHSCCRKIDRGEQPCMACDKMLRSLLRILAIRPFFHQTGSIFLSRMVRFVASRGRCSALVRTERTLCSSVVSMNTPLLSAEVQAPFCGFLSS
ncbi:unnamed protein product [Ectocarpus sp. 4 AP-2014]